MSSDDSTPSATSAYEFPTSPVVTFTATMTAFTPRARRAAPIPRLVRSSTRPN